MSRRVLVVAHPDDEVLWFGSLAREVDEVVIAFQASTEDAALGARRAALIPRLPYTVTALELDEPGSFLQADWAHPQITEMGIALAEPAYARYRASHRDLLEALHCRLDGAQVFTHNPWGEYGHEDHVLVHRAVSQVVASENVCVPVVHSPRSAQLASQYRMGAQSRVFTFTNDTAWCERVKRMYQQGACWTWYDGWTAPGQLSFVTALVRSETGHPAPLSDVVDAA